ncbi:hypothetical protein [Haemophilus parainfluenzae]|uniref:hypothetical protein n=1 Tax=Haemophilus parainfluenzae TaxID=729 RepID=UPI000E0FC193|nr:hypothetical protein [Haemophilus parainfluenzae]MBS6283922.1 hypothetical protein [Haemophilus parainfluenzae]
MAVVNQFNTKIGDRAQKEFWGESAVGFGGIFEVKKRLRKRPHFFKNRTMVQASSLGPNKHKRGRLRYLGDIILI